MKCSTQLRMKFRIFFCFLTLLSINVFSQGREVPADTLKELFTMSFNELLSLKVESATKHEETVFESPLSATTISRQEIIQSGVTTIAEALRLSAGTLVRQQNTGYFNMHLRGFDDVLPVGNQLTQGTNSMTLVMIDGRPVFNYFQGGTFWEALPIGLNDIEKIEVIRGPSSALYGPNAVAGVIHIFTRKGSFENGTSVKSSFQTSASGDVYIGSSVKESISDQFTFGISANMASVDRGMKDYFGYRQMDYVEKDSLRFLGVGGAERYPNEEVALENYGVNAYLGFHLEDKIESVVSAGVQQSEVQKIYADNLTTPFSTNTSESGYVDVSTKVLNFQHQVSIQKGYQNTVGMRGWEYDFDVFNSTLEYEKSVKNFKFRPGISYSAAVYDDEKAILKYGSDRAFLGGEHLIDSKSMMLHSEYKLKTWRAIAALRYDVYNVPNKGYFTYQYMLTKTFNNKHMVRGGVSKSNRGSFMLDSYYNQRFEQPIPSINKVVVTELEGNKNLNLLVMQMYELGYRYSITNKFSLSLALNRETTNHYSSLVEQASADPFTYSYKFQNLDIQAIQHGGEVDVVFTPNKALFFKAFANIQNTKWKNDGFINKETGDTLNGFETHLTTPTIYGGGEVNVTFLKKYTINVNSYFMSKQVMNTAVRLNEEGKYYEVPSVVVLNAKFSYALSTSMKLFVNGRNILAKNQLQSAWADKLNPVYLIGIDFDL